MSETPTDDPAQRRGTGTRREWLRAISGLTIVGGLSGCSQPDSSLTSRTPSPSGRATNRDREGGIDDRAPLRLVAHEFVPVGQTRSLGEIGTDVEVIEFDGRLELDAEAGTFTPLESGVACIRAQYRETTRQNQVQTKCVVGIDEVGPCDGLEPYAFDLQRFIERPGNSNWLAHGLGSFYEVCRTAVGLRLERSDRELPPLYLGIVDALGDGDYSLGPTEYGWQRRGTIRTYSGEVIDPPWVVFLGPGPPKSGTITEEGTVEVDFADCDESPSCTFDPAFVRPGDVVEVTPAGIGGLSNFREQYGEDEAAGRINTLLDRHGVTAFEWKAIDERLGPFDTGGDPNDLIDLDVKGIIFERMVRLQGLERTLEFFDDVHSLREKGVTVSLSDDLNNSPVKCPFPDPEAEAICNEFEDAVAAAEDRTLATLAEAYDLWLSIDHWEEPGMHRPRVDTVDGVVFRYGFSGESSPESDLRSVPAEVREWMISLTERYPELQVLLVGEAPVSVVTANGDQCEAEYCPSIFEASYRLNEAVLQAVLEQAAENVIGFAVRTFEGAHFDIRKPVEDRFGYELNRIGETGYNNPILNIYATQ